MSTGRNIEVYHSWYLVGWLCLFLLFPLYLIILLSIMILFAFLTSCRTYGHLHQGNIERKALSRKVNRVATYKDWFFSPLLLHCHCCMKLDSLTVLYCSIKGRITLSLRNSLLRMCREFPTSVLGHVLTSSYPRFAT